MGDYDKTLTVGIERGKISGGGPGAYVVESFTRGGVETRPIAAANEYVSECTCDGRSKYLYSAGDEVFYFMFPDGRGMILGKSK